MVKLRNREFFGFPPFTTAIVRVPHPAVVADENHLCVCGIDPHIVRIAVRSLEPAYGRETLAAVLADNECPIGLEQAVGVFLVHNENCKIKWTPHHPLTPVALFPRLAAV